jgi:DNA-binding CsgD family transcriptional regulator
LLSVVRRLARDGPVLLAVDDVQWLDTSSAEALSFAARRLDGASVRLLLTQRAGAPNPLDRALKPDAPLRIDVPGLSLGATRRLLYERLALSLPRSVLRRIYESTRGNPLFALEIGRVLAERGLPSPEEPLPIPDDMRSLVRGRVAALPEPTQELLLAAALVAHPAAETLRVVLARPLDGDLEPAERAGVAGLDRGLVAFAHPLYAGAVVTFATSAERRRMHRRLAETVPGLEERARHLALAVEGTDEGAARTIHSAARDALLRGAPTAAAELAELAVELGDPESVDRPRRIVDLGKFLHTAAEPERARVLLSDAHDLSSWPAALQARARAQLLLSTYWSKGAVAAVELGERMLDEHLPSEVRATVHAYLSGCCEFDLTQARRHGDAALVLLERLGDDADPGDLTHALAMRVRSGVVLGQGLDQGLIDRVLELEERIPAERSASERMSHYFGVLFKHVDDLDTSRHWLERHLAEAIDAQDEVMQLVMRTHLALTECWAGNLAVAREHLAATEGLLDDIGTRNVGLLGVSALVEAHGGNVDAVREIEARLQAEHGDPGAEVYGFYLGAGVGLIELSLGNVRAADERFAALLEALEAGGHREPGIFRVHANAAEAAVAVGDLARAERIADHLADHAERTDHRWSRAMSGRIRALVAAGRSNFEEALEHADRALSVHARLAMPFERARTLLVRGMVERRAKRRGQARRTLEEAAGEFERIGARLWAERARAELARVSGRRPRAQSELTPTEQRVVELAAEGRSNKEIAQALFVTPHTVELHLSHAYAKLGVRSRVQLASRLAGTADVKD